MQLVPLYTQVTLEDRAAYYNSNNDNAGGGAGCCVIS